MTTMRKGLMVAAAVAAIFATAPAHADSTGIPGKIIGLEHNDDSSDDGGVRDGTLFVDEGADTPRRYLWGGALCPGRELDIFQQGMLLDAMRSKLLVLPYYKIGNAASRCLTSFILTAKKRSIDDIAK